MIRGGMVGLEMVLKFSDARLRAEAIWGKAESERMADVAVEEAVQTWTRESPPEVLNRHIRERLILEVGEGK